MHICMMYKWVLRKIALLPIHLVLWILVWLFFIYFFSYGSDNEKFVYSFSTSLLPITITVTYTIIYYLIPEFLIKRLYMKFGIYLLYTIVCSLFCIIIITFVNYIFISDFNMNNMPLLTRNFIFVFILVYLVAGLFSFVQLLGYNYKTVYHNAQLEKKIIQGQLQIKEKELHLLKEQIHPHFLFNTLNTIYGAALKKSEDTPDLILKLSNLLDYTLNQIEKPKVAITEEVSYLESYIGLERIRFKDSLHVTFNKQIEKDIHIPPMLFIAFIENAFKHGAPVKGFLEVYIELKVKQ